MRLIKNDPKFNESWPRALVPYSRIYGVDEPESPPRLSNNGSISKHLPEGTPFSLVGTSSFYKRESYPDGVVPEGSVTATFSGGNDPWKGLDAFTSHGNGMPLNMHNQGGDVGRYTNDDIHAVRILAMEPTSDRHRGANNGRRFFSHAMERLRILGEIPLRKFNGDQQPIDPDGNSDTSFLAKIPADTAFTFQTLDKNGLVLNTAQTWHQLRPGEKRVNCGGCHAHSQSPTPFEDTMAARDDYEVWDLVNSTPLLTTKQQDDSKKQWSATDDAGLRTVRDEIVNVEYHRDVRPILERSCVACHNSKDGKMPAGNLDLDADVEMIDIPHTAKIPGTYYRLAADEAAKFGHKPIGYDSWGYPNASRYIRKLQSRRSLLIWKVYGERLDGFSNDDHPSESMPGARELQQAGKPVEVEKNRHRWDLDFTGSPMPPPAAVQAGKVKPLSDEDRRTLARWIDLGCPIDLDYDSSDPSRRGYGWMLDDNRPILTVTYPQPGANKPLSRIVIGAHDYYTGLDEGNISVTADFAVNGAAPGTNLAERFQPKTQGVWELQLDEPLRKLQRGLLTVAVNDGQGNETRIERTFSVSP
jgi:hypothetical protein